MSKKYYAYAYETGYRDGSTHYELEHCPACKNVADLQAALDKNAELRDEIKHLLIKRQHTEDANTELRELVLRLYADLCIQETTLELIGILPSETVKDEMRAIVNKCGELGIEVPEWQT